MKGRVIAFINKISMSCKRTKASNMSLRRGDDNPLIFSVAMRNVSIWGGKRGKKRGVVIL